MNQYELIERLKEVAKYDEYDISGTYISEIKTSSPSQNIYEEERPFEFLDLEYHTSFDWSIPVFSVAQKQANELHIDGYYAPAFTAINQNDPLQFFINLSDLIREIKKYK